MALLCVVAALTLAVAAPASATSYSATAWGNNIWGQLGDGTEVGPEGCFAYQVGEEFRPGYCSSFVVSVNELSGVTAVSAGGEHSLALLSNGTVMAWGSNVSGQLGDGTTGGDSNVPVVVKGLTGVTAISASRYFSLALLSNGTVMAWGNNDDGNLGNGTTTSSDVPAAVSELTGVTAISAGKGPNVFGDAHSLALLSNGTVMAWGDNGSGELGNGKTGGYKDVPVAVKKLSGVAAISAGSGFSLAALENGTTMAWGANERGQLGDGSTTNTDLPVVVSELSGVTAVSAGAEHSLALLSNGTVMAWGNNLEGQLGDGIDDDTSDLPVAVSELSGVAAIAAGGLPGGLQGELPFEHSLALLSNGTVMAWGSNVSGQLGDGSTQNSSVPAAVIGLSGVEGISAGGVYSLAFGPPVPDVFSVAPNQGPESGGTSVTITGVHFTQATAVDFGSSSASFTVDSDSSITAVSPPGIGTVDVTVTTPEGTTPTSSTDRFSYGVPTVIKISPRDGPLAGGTAVTITGANFTKATAVTFGSIGASSFTVKSPTEITAITPPAATVGFVYVIVTTPGGTNGPSPQDVFNYVPTVTSVSPNSGPTAGGTSVTVSGTGFEGDFIKFSFGSAYATAVNCTSTTTCTMHAPAHEAGTVNVKARVKSYVYNGVIHASSKKNPPADQFTYE
jgi:alpha-tubulin suppressor-like RCC1 family protein